MFKAHVLSRRDVVSRVQLQVERHAVAGVLRLIERERSGEAVPRPLLASVCRLFNSLGTYGTAIQRPLVESAGVWYAQEGGRLVSELGVAEYLSHCEVSEYSRAG